MAHAVISEDGIVAISHCQFSPIESRSVTIEMSASLVFGFRFHNGPKKAVEADSTNVNLNRWLGGPEINMACSVDLLSGFVLTIYASFQPNSSSRAQLRAFQRLVQVP